MLRRNVALLLLSLGLATPAQALRLAYLCSDGLSGQTLEAYRALLKEHPELQGKLELRLATESAWAALKRDDLLKADVLVLDMMNQHLVERFKADFKVDLIPTVAARGKVLAVGSGLLPESAYAAQGALLDPEAKAYWSGQGFDNHLNLMKRALTLAGVAGLQTQPPKAHPDFGYYYPDHPRGRIFSTWAEFEAWHRQSGKLKANAPWIAVGFYSSSYYSGETEPIDGAVAGIERGGANALPVFGYPGAVAFERLLRDEQGRPRADAALAFLFRFADYEAQKALGRLGIPIINCISLYGRSESEWRASDQGLSLFEGTFQVAVPELAGLLAPTVVGSQERERDAQSGAMISRRKAIPERVERAVARALRLVALRRKANHDKRLALLFYNYPPGKAGVGASYLNVAESISNIVKRLAAEGYDVGGKTPSGEEVLAEIMKKARNVAGHAPGELRALVQEGGAILVGWKDYQRWLGSMDARFKAKAVKDWGEASKGGPMFLEQDGEKKLVIPVIQWGKLAVLPQPARGWGEDLSKLYHAQDLAPPHNYIGVYAWLRQGYKADALIHLGTHGTLEWLDGKSIGLEDADAPEALIADLPNVYIYNVDVVGEGLVARRRSAAALVDHMIPPLKQGGLYAKYSELSELISDQHLSQSKHEELSSALAEEVRIRALALGLDKDLGWDLSREGTLNDLRLHQLEDYLSTLKSQNIPYGLHRFGWVPDEGLRASTAQAVAEADESLSPSKREALKAEMDRRIQASGPRELDSLMLALRGGYLPGGNGNEPVRNPDAYPTGKNFYGVDPDKVPKKASYKLGVRLADQMLKEHFEKHGKYPEKVSFVIWGDETMRHEGVIEAQIFHLLGTRPVWNERGKVVDVELIPRRELGRPRVDIVIACAAEGMFNNVTLLMDKAVQLVKRLEEPDNAVRRHFLATRDELMRRGYTREQADKRAGVRIFDEPPGRYNLNTSRMTEASGTWDSDKVIADDYLRKMGHGYGNGFWGEPMEDVFREALKGTEKVVHSNSTALYGTLDNDDFFMYAGGLALAVRSLDGKSPEVLVTNVRDPRKPEMSSLDKFMGLEFRSRYVNPTWIQGMKKEGYAGAGEMRAFVEYLWGWQVTVPESVDAAKWQEVYEVYVEDKHAQDLPKFFEEKSPYAFQDMSGRLVESIRKGYWKPTQAVRDRLVREYTQSVAKHGVSCSDTVCANPKLAKAVGEWAQTAGVPVPVQQAFKRAIEKATGKSIEGQAQAMDRFVKQTAQSLQERSEQAAAGPGKTKQVVGYVMEQFEATKAATQKTMKRLDWEEWQLGLGGLLAGLAAAWALRRWRAKQV